MIEISQNEKKDFVLMQLLHYFITVENYSPMVVKGAKNEVWLEKMDAPYRIIRINANHIHNDEQLNTDLFMVKSIIRQVKKKTLSFSVNTLNILIDINGNIEINNPNNIDCITVDSEKGLESSSISEMYPSLKNNLIPEDDKLEFIMNITNNINKKNEEESIKYNSIFGEKKTIITPALIFINVAICFLANFLIVTDKIDLFTLLANNRVLVKEGQVYRLLTSAFLHQNLFHLIFNMYALSVIGNQVESFVGKWKYLIIYLVSALTGSLLSCVINTGWSLGASGAIFGLMGMLLYFGLFYRLYLDKALKTQIVPLILMNLGLGFIISGIDNAAHIGGLFGGFLISMALGVSDNKKISDRINGTICLIILVGFLSYLLFLK